MLSLILALVGPAVGALIIFSLPFLSNRIRNLITLFFCLVSAFFTWTVAVGVYNGTVFSVSGTLGGFAFSVAPDLLGALFSLIISTLWLFTAVYSFGYMENKHNQRSYYTFFLLSLSVALGVAFSGNLIALYLFYELLTFATYPLVIHNRNKKAIKAGSKYIVYNLLGAGLILIGIILTYVFSGNLEFSSAAILKDQSGFALNWLLVIFIAGFGVKAALMPFHKWLPEAMEAPTPISALLHAVAVVYSGVYGILRVVYSIFGVELMKELQFANALKWVAAFTILAGVFIAAKQDVLKRRLAYQTVSHLSYILLGAFIFNEYGFYGALLQMIAYCVFKLILFYCAGIISERTGETKISKMRGIAYSSPLTMAAFSVGALAMVGMLPFLTFWSKYFLMAGSISSGNWILAIVLIISGIVNAYCFVPVLVNAFKKDTVRYKKKKDKSYVLMLAPTMVLTVVSLIAGFFPLPFLSVCRKFMLFLFNGGI